MGDRRFDPAYERLKGAPDRVAELARMPFEDIVAALAGASKAQDPLLANILATEVLNRHRRGVARSAARVLAVVAAIVLATVGFVVEEIHPGSEPDELSFVVLGVALAIGAIVARVAEGRIRRRRPGTF
jgi:peptidoglycan/LPS O-acetylase OafA/YrhL